MKRIAMVAVTSLLAGCSNLNGSLEGALGGDPDPQSGQQGQQIEVVEMGEYQSVSTEIATQDEQVQGEMVGFNNGMQPGKPTMDGHNPPAQHLFFFGFDSSTIVGEDLEIVQGHAAYLINNPVMLIRLEGHADERGSREYNLSLGERRAQTMSDLLVAEGVNPGQIEIISYGEEKPLEMGHEEAFWAQNRRVELTYPQ
ncbi:MAG: peptidoglycan-associated lipoprotein Pal [Gammaproteobacteria bacterium]|nr:peptidoglycan-associated lipoprotein Pal [Gammaproteobacteria bacterium]